LRNIDKTSERSIFTTRLSGFVKHVVERMRSGVDDPELRERLRQRLQS
jgi:hypothetical protein